MRYKLFNFDPKDKSNWGNYQIEISNLFNKCRELLVESLGFREGFIILFVRKKTYLWERIKPFLDLPTSSQRGYYWGVVIPAIKKAAEQNGQFHESDQALHCDIKQALKDNCGIYAERVSKITGEVYREIISISDEKGNKEDTAKFINTVINWAADFYGIEIPEANFAGNGELGGVL